MKGSEGFSSVTVIGFILDQSIKEPEQRAARGNKV